MKIATMRAIAVLVVLIALAACSTFNFGKLNRLEKGLTSYNVKKMMDKDPEIESKVFIENLDSIKLEFYKVPQFYYFVLAYQQDSLFYWGLPQDFKRSHNKTYNAIGDSAYQIILND